MSFSVPLKISRPLSVRLIDLAPSFELGGQPATGGSSPARHIAQPLVQMAASATATTIMRFDMPSASCTQLRERLVHEVLEQPRTAVNSRYERAVEGGARGGLDVRRDRRNDDPPARLCDLQAAAQLLVDHHDRAADPDVERQREQCAGEVRGMQMYVV